MNTQIVTLHWCYYFRHSISKYRKIVSTLEVLQLAG